MNIRRIITYTAGVVLTAAVCVEGYYIYRHAQDIETLAARLAPGSSQTQATSDSDSWPSLDSESVLGRVAVHDDGDRYVVTTRLPGVNEENIQVSLKGERLSITAERHGRTYEPGDSQDAGSAGDFVAVVERDITLPGPVDDSGLTRDYDKGVLTVTIRKQNV